MKTILLKMFFCVLSLFILLACSNDEEEQTKMSALEQKQHEIAQEAVSRIKTPINKAEKARKMLDNHAKELEKKHNNK